MTLSEKRVTADVISWNEANWQDGPLIQCNQFSSVAVVSSSLQPQGLQHARPPCPSPAPGAYSDSFHLSQRCHPTSSSSVVPFSSCLQSFPVSGSFPVSQFFPSGGQSTGASASAIRPSNDIQDWSPLGWTGWIFLQSKGLPSIFSNTTVQYEQWCPYMRDRRVTCVFSNPWKRILKKEYIYIYIYNQITLLCT